MPWAWRYTPSGCLRWPPGHQHRDEEHQDEEQWAKDRALMHTNSHNKLPHCNDHWPAYSFGHWKYWNIRFLYSIQIIRALRFILPLYVPGPRLSSLLTPHPPPPPPTTLVQVMALCRHTASHYLSHCWPSFCNYIMLPSHDKLKWQTYLYKILTCFE